MPQSIYNAFTAYINKHQLINSEKPILLAVSGGLDSIVLVDLFAKLGVPFGIAHCNFNLRGKEAEEDMKFVKTLAIHHNIPCDTKTFDTAAYATKHQISIQMAARQLRYAWFDELMKKKGYSLTATAHHHNDQIETFLRNTIKGTGILGLRGMLPKRDNIIHPLLFATKTDLKAYATAQGLFWREDSSNSEVKYERNFLRHKVIPMLKSLNPDLETTFQHTITKLQQTALFFIKQAEDLKKKVWTISPPYYRLSLQPLQKEPWAPLLISYWLAPFKFSFPMIQKWWDNPPQPGKQLQTGEYWLLADRTAWIIGPQHPQDEQITHTINAFPFTQHLNGHQLKMAAPMPAKAHYYKQKTSLELTIAQFDYQKIKLPLTLRLWKPGDSFAPLGMGGQRKKISDFLIDIKLPRYQKERVYVLCAAGDIIWVVGHRISELYKISPHTQQTLLCTYAPLSLEAE